MDTTQLRGLVFLLSFGELTLGCNGDDTGASDTGTNTTNQTTNPGTDSADSTTTQPGESDSDTTGASTAGTTAGTADPSASAGFLTTNTSSTTADPSTTGPDFPPPSELCAAYAELIVECYPRYSGYFNYFGYYCDSAIAEGIDLDGPACGAALEELYACISGLTCREYYAEFEPDPIQCAAPFADAEKACPNFFEPF